MESTGAHSSDESNYAPVQERPFHVSTAGGNRNNVPSSVSYTQWLVLRTHLNKKEPQVLKTNGNKNCISKTEFLGFLTFDTFGKSYLSTSLTDATNT